jgi:hypothetical protein
MERIPGQGRFVGWASTPAESAVGLQRKTGTPQIVTADVCEFTDEVRREPFDGPKPGNQACQQ